MQAARRLPSTISKALVAWLALVVSLPAADQPTAQPPLARLPDFSLVDAAGARHTCADWAGAKGVVLLFLGAECPVSNGYSPTFRQLAASYGQQGITVVGIHCDPTLTGDAAAAHAKEYGLPFTILLDPEQLLARGCGVRVTPEAVVALPDGDVVYRGRVDNKYSLDGKRRDEPTEHDLVAAIDALLAGRTPSVRETKAFGCPLPRTAKQ